MSSKFLTPGGRCSNMHEDLSQHQGLVELHGEVKVHGMDVFRKDKVYKSGSIKVHCGSGTLWLQVDYRSGSQPNRFDIVKESIAARLLNRDIIWFKAAKSAIIINFRKPSKDTQSRMIEDGFGRISSMIESFAISTLPTLPSSGFVAASELQRAVDASSPREIPFAVNTANDPHCSASKTFYGRNSLGQPFKSPLPANSARCLTPKSLFKLKQ
jgi:hypothetical protein